MSIFIRIVTVRIAVTNAWYLITIALRVDNA